MAYLTSAQMLAAVAAGNVVSYRGRLLRIAGDVPSDDQIATDASADATAASDVADAKQAVLDAADHLAATGGGDLPLSVRGQLDPNPSWKLRAD